MRSAPRDQGFTVAATLLARLVRHAETAGVPGALLLEGSGIERAQLDDPTARAPRRVYHEAFERAARLTGDPDFGLRCGEFADMDAFHVVGYLVDAQPSLTEMLEKLAGVSRILDDASVSSVHRASGEVAYVTEEPSLDAARPRQAAEFAMAAFVTLLRGPRRDRWSPRRVAFMHPRPASIHGHLRVFGVVPEFGHGRLEASFEDAPAPLRSAAPALAGHLERYASQLLTELPAEGVAQRVERFIATRLCDRHLSIEHAARASGMSARSLQRSLAADGARFADVLDRARRDAARKLLSTPDASLSEVAARVGFADARCLRRAVRRWFGVSVEALRTGA